MSLSNPLLSDDDDYTSKINSNLIKRNSNKNSNNSNELQTRDYVEMRNEKFSPHPFEVEENLDRIGVPGYKLFDQNFKVLRLWQGSSLQQVFPSGMFKFYILFFTGILIAFASVQYDNSLRATVLNTSTTSSINSLCIFTLTFFISNTLSKVNTRFENVCKTNGYVTRCTALCATLYPPKEAKAIIRYTNSILHVYYLLMSGPMNDLKWNKLLNRGLLTQEEIIKLQLQGSPGVVLYTWALHILKFNENKLHQTKHNEVSDAEASLTSINMWGKGMLPYQLNIETCIGGTRGLAAKQIAYSLFQSPLLYFHSVYISVTIYLLCTCYDSGHNFARALNEPCHLIAPNPTPESIDDDGSHLNGQCVSSCITVILAQIVLIIVFLSILKTAEKLSDAYGSKAYHYDLGVDLDNLWQESLNVLKSMEVPRPSY